jgi:long-chain acyl-CoA synthetase
VDRLLVKPYSLVAVPTVFKRIYAGLWAKMNKDGGLAKTLFMMGIEAAKKKRELAAKASRFYDQSQIQTGG